MLELSQYFLGSTSNGLTHLSLASFLWDIGKQHSPRCDAAERYSVCREKFHRKLI